MNIDEFAAKFAGHDLVRARPSAMKVLHLSVTNTWGNRTLSTDSPEWKKLREEVLKRDDYKCRFCGIRATSWMVVDHMNGVASENNLWNLGVNCQMCDRIRHCGLAGMKGLLMLGTSSMPQVDIVRRTRDYVKEHRKIPKAVQIATDAKPVDEMKIVDFANILLETDWERLPSRMKNYRGFFTGKFDRWQVEA